MDEQRIAKNSKETIQISHDISELGDQKNLTILLTIGSLEFPTGCISLARFGVFGAPVSLGFVQFLFPNLSHGPFIDCHGGFVPKDVESLVSRNDPLDAAPQYFQTKDG